MKEVRSGQSRASSIPIKVIGPSKETRVLSDEGVKNKFKLI